jgi:hypothetical protein
MRTFTHTFDPAHLDPAGAQVALSVDEIEEAGVKEVLQMPGAALGSWAILDALLAPTGLGSPFTYKEPLGQAREVKVALSCLFGRFVARAYLTHYFNLSIFAHLGRRSLKLNRMRNAEVVQTARGDLPDWVACRSDLSGATVAEAKGCHDRSGPAAALERAWRQAQRVDVLIGGRRETVKRVAIATRWGAAWGGPTVPLMAVKDPTDEGDPITDEEKGIIAVGLARRRAANLLRPLGEVELANALKALAETPFHNLVARETQRARSALDASRPRRVRRLQKNVNLMTC